MNTEFEIGTVVRLLEPISVLYQQSPRIELVFHPGIEGIVMHSPPTLEQLMVVDVVGWHPLAVKPTQVQATGEVVCVEIVSEEEIEAE